MNRERSERATAAVTPVEDTRIRTAAEVRGESRSSFLRRAALRDARRVLREDDEAADGSAGEEEREA